MRFVVYGVGAIGGCVAAALALAGEDVAGIARGAQLEAIRDRGLLLRTPDRTAMARFDCYAGPEEIGVRDDDVVLLTMKTQDTAAALERLRDAGVDKHPVLCVQNGVANERMAARFFPNVYGVTVMMPAVYLVPGEVNVFSLPRHGIFGVGRFPSGRDATVDAICAALERANIAAFPRDDVMAGKYGKLLLNLGNVIEARLGPEVASRELYAPVRREAEAVYRAAGVVARNVGEDDPRRQELMQQHEIDGVSRTGGSSTQSLVRGTGSIETDYLNGEIVLLGRLHGVPTPLNAALVALGQELVGKGAKPGSMSDADLRKRLGI